jgi:hypothetical protein
MRNNGIMSGADEIGTMAAGMLLANEIERAHAGAPAVGHDANEPCANCGATRVGPYCHACGQVGHVHRNLGALVHDIAHGVFHFEGKLWKTLPMLALHPGDLTRRYVHGERAKFVSPMALFLFSVFLLFAVVSNLAGHGNAPNVIEQVSLAGELAQERTKLANLEAREKKETDAEDKADLAKRIVRQTKEVASLDALLRSGPEAVAREEQARRQDREKFNIKTGIPWLESTLNHVADNPKLALYKLKMNAYKYSWALIPISLPFIWLLFFWKRGVGLYDHAIFSIYSLSFMSLAVITLVVLGKVGLPSWIIAFAAMIIPPLHMYRQLKEAYLLSRFSAIWRTCALLIITTITSSLFLSFLIYLGNE